MNMFLKFMALILCGGASVAIAFMRFKVLMEPEVALIFFTIGAVISLIVGVPSYYFLSGDSIDIACATWLVDWYVHY